MKRSLQVILIVAGLAGTVQAHAQWRLEKSPTLNSLNAVCIVDRNSAWIAGDRGTILYKAGGEWKNTESPTKENLYALSMIDKNDIWAVGSRGTIIHYTGGKWQLESSPTKRDLYSVNFRNKDNGVAVGALGTILVYENGKWSLSDQKSKGSLFASVFGSKSDLWVGGGMECMEIPVLKLAYMEGRLATVNSFSSHGTVNSISFIDASNAWAVGSPSLLLHFNGQRWEAMDPGFRFPSLKSVSFRNDGNGICVGYEGTVMICRNGIWEIERSAAESNLNGVIVKDSIIYAVGDKGTILTMGTIPDKINGISPRKDKSGIVVYPNPADDILNFTISAYEEFFRATITIITPGGNKLVLEPLKSGGENNLYTIATKELENGFYILEVRTGDKIFTGKFVVKH